MADTTDPGYMSDPADMSDAGGPPCSIAAAVDVIGDRWSVLILRDVFRGVNRFTELQQDLGIARNVLSNRLGKLVDHGVLRPVAYRQRPLRHEYRLTRKGADLSAALIALMRWGDRWYAPQGPPTELFHDACGATLVSQPRCPDCDVLVAPGDVRSRPGPGRRPPAAHRSRRGLPLRDGALPPAPDAGAPTPRPTRRPSATT